MNKLKPYVDNKEELKKLVITKPDDPDLPPELRILHKFRSDQKFWEFLGKNYGVMNEISDWHVYRRASKIGHEPLIQTKAFGKTALDLLKKGNVKQFNEMRLKLEMSELDLSSAALVSAKLVGVDLSKAKLVGADLGSVDLKLANLMRANLLGANLNYAELENVNLSGANLTGANLTGANLTGANLENAVLVNAILALVTLVNTDLTGANLENTIIINPRRYDGMILSKKAKVDKAVIDDSRFIQYIRQFTNKLPKNIDDKRQLKIKLKELPDTILENLLEISNLPN